LRSSIALKEPPNIVVRAQEGKGNPLAFLDIHASQGKVNAEFIDART
jgi:hypothetical protein